jgi:hypothetical protein
MILEVTEVEQNIKVIIDKNATDIEFFNGNGIEKFIWLTIFVLVILLLCCINILRGVETLPQVWRYLDIFG